MTEHGHDLEVRRDVAAMTPDELKQTYSIAKALALSKRFPDAKTADEAFAKILVGRDLGLSPTQALTGLHIVEGKPQIAAVTLAGFVRKSSRYDYAIAEHTDELCRITFWGENDELGDSTFTMVEARTAGLVKPKSNWEKWPKNMLFARAMSNGVKWFCPDLMGGVPIYTEADTFEGTASELTDGDGDGEPVGWRGIDIDQVGRLESVLRRAKECGHAGFADRAAIEMIVNGQARDFVAEWVDTANDELSALVPKVTPEEARETAEVILDAAEAPNAIGADVAAQAVESLERRRGELLDEIAGQSHQEGREWDELHAELAEIERALGPAQIAGQEKIDL